MITLDKDDRMWFLLSILVPLFAWWYFQGRKKYNVKGFK